MMTHDELAYALQVFRHENKINAAEAQLSAKHIAVHQLPTRVLSKCNVNTAEHFDKCDSVKSITLRWIYGKTSLKARRLIKSAVTLFLMANILTNQTNKDFHSEVTRILLEKVSMPIYPAGSTFYSAPHHICVIDEFFTTSKHMIRYNSNNANKLMLQIHLRLVSSWLFVILNSKDMKHYRQHIRTDMWQKGQSSTFDIHDARRKQLASYSINMSHIWKPEAPIPTAKPEMIKSDIDFLWKILNEAINPPRILAPQ